MPRFEVEMKIASTFPQIDGMPTIRMGEGFDLVWAEGTWVSRIAIQANDQTEAVTMARQLASDKIPLFEVFLAGSSTPFSFFLSEGPATVRNLNGGTITAGSSLAVSASAGISATASILITSRIPSAVAALNTITRALIGESDCEVPLYYHSRAMRESDHRHNFLDNITAIEAMLSETPDTTETLARRLAVLVSGERSNLQRTYDDFKGFYRTRSKIVHGDKIEALTEGTVNEIAELTRLAVRGYLLMRRTLTEKELKGKLDRFFDPTTLDEVKQLTSLTPE